MIFLRISPLPSGTPSTGSANTLQSAFTRMSENKARSAIPSQLSSSHHPANAPRDGILNRRRLRKPSCCRTDHAQSCKCRQPIFFHAGLLSGCQFNTEIPREQERIFRKRCGSGEIKMEGGGVCGKRRRGRHPFCFSSCPELSFR